LTTRSVTGNAGAFGIITETGSIDMGGSGSATVSLNNARPNATYSVAISGNANETFWITAKTATGFTVNSSNSSSTAQVDFLIEG
jgi:hypothetical protein